MNPPGTWRDQKASASTEVQNDGLKSRACRGLSCWCARYTGLKVFKCMRGCMLEERTSKASPKVCYNSESTRAQRPAGSVCAHAIDGRPYLAQGSSMQYNRRNQTQCACETISRKRNSSYKQGRTYIICWPNASKTSNHNDHHLL